jgi:hypothetical protein
MEILLVIHPSLQSFLLLLHSIKQAPNARTADVHDTATPNSRLFLSVAPAKASNSAKCKLTPIWHKFVRHSKDPAKSNQNISW